MNTRNKLVALGCLTALGVTAAWAKTSPEEYAVLKGATQIRQPNGSWTNTDRLAANSWVRCTVGDATLRLPGMTVRLEKGTSLKTGDGAGGPAKLEARGGRAYFKVDANSPGCYVATAHKQIHATESEFVLDAGVNEKLYVLDGQASIVNEQAGPRELGAWAKSGLDGVALDGPDVRRRNRNRRRFTQGEENKGKRIGEDQPPSTPRPVETQTPAYTPSATPTYTPTATPSLTPTPSPSPQVVDGGFDPWPLIGGIVGAGGIAAFVILNDDDDDDRRIVFPASP